MGSKKCIVCKVAMILLIIGGINWGLAGVFDFNLVSKLLGEGSALSKAVYGLVGLAGVLGLMTCIKDCKACCKPAS